MFGQGFAMKREGRKPRRWIKRKGDYSDAKRSMSRWKCLPRGKKGIAQGGLAELRKSAMPRRTGL